MMDWTGNVGTYSVRAPWRVIATFLWNYDDARIKRSVPNGYYAIVILRSIFMKCIFYEMYFFFLYQT